MTTRSTPRGFTPGSLALAGAWGVAVAVARLTGAAAVVLLLVSGLVAMLLAALSGWWRLRSVEIGSITTPATSTTGDSARITVHLLDPGASAPLTLEVFGIRLPIAPSPGTTTVDVAVDITTPSPGVFTETTCTIESSGIAGLLTWRRRQVVELDALHVAPAAAGPVVEIEHTSSDVAGSSASGTGPKTGDLDGARPWRPGEGDQAIHWPSTLRTGEVIAYDRTAASESTWTVSLDNDPAQLRWTLDDGRRRGHDVFVRDTEPSTELGTDTTPSVHQVSDADDALRWAAIAAHRANRSDAAGDESIPFWKRTLSLRNGDTQNEPVPRAARALVGVAALLSLWMLLGALNGSLTERLLATFGVGVATAASMRYSGGHRPWWARALVIFIAAAALGRIGVQTAGIGGLLAALRGPMPELLMLLVVLHGAEIADKRTARVHVALTGVVVAYAAGLRIDGLVGWWLLTWGVAAIAAFCRIDVIASTTSSTDSAARAPAALRSGAVRRSLTWAGAGIACTIGVAALVPVPDGPASLGLPSISNSEPTTGEDGALVGSDGTPSEPTSTGDPTRGALGQAGGYPGFSDTLDTAVRGDLSDEVVMRVRAPEPAFWRGQTFTEFDGRVWRVSDVADRRIEGPNITINPTIGDEPMQPVPTEEFVQTFFVEADLPNVVFAAARPSTVIFDGSVFARADGAIRADRSLSAGTVYSVVSQRVPVTEASLRAQGDLGDRFAPFTDVPEVAQYLALPDSTSQATLDLAASLRVDGSTYDTVRAYEQWMADNTQYDLNAPVPEGDAVDDFLFNSQRGFCEQIASSLVVMLRSQGVPARLATGFIPGTRNQISGVFEVRSSDAHAWVEVWFPDSGWEAFDPTATVPLAGESERTTVGGDAAAAIISGVLSRPVHIGAALALGAAALAALRLITEQRRRRSRGQWGLLHDRFMALAPDERTAPRVADRVSTHAPGNVATHDVAHGIAHTLDRAAFDPTFERDDETLTNLSRDISTLERELASTSSS